MAIQLNRVGKTYHTSFSRKKIHAVIDVSLSIEPGEIFGIIGPNGAGKSTLLKMLMGFIQPTTGHISILGGAPKDPKTKQKLGYLPENPYFYDHLSAEELMRFSARTSGMARTEADRRIDSLLEELSISHARKRKLRSYSKGMTQRAGICFALVHDPELIIFDEPMSGLDPIGRKDVVDLVLKLKRQGKTVLFCSHILNDVERLCDRMAIMNKGRLLKIMTRNDLEMHARNIVLSCSEIPQPMAERLEEMGVIVTINSDETRISCPKVAIDQVMQLLREQDISIQNYQTSTDALESIFFDIIKSKNEQ